MPTDEQYADLIQTRWLDVHHSYLTGAMVVACARWYAPHIKVKFMAAYLAVAACETSLADPKLGGRLVTDAYNFGCVKGRGTNDTPWGRLAVGSVSVGGSRWYRFPDAWTGAAALGRLLKTGPAFRPGFYLRCIEDGDFASLTKMYYGDLPDLADYQRRWLRFYDIFSHHLGDVH